MIAGICKRYLKPKSVVDVGCGVGHLLSLFEKTRGRRVLGLEGDWLDPKSALIKEQNLKFTDLEQPLDLDERFDMAICLEVAEHLEPSRGESFVQDLTELSDVVVFSAAIQGQGGTGHKNERWQDYWASLFQECGYGFYDLFRPKLWQDENVLAWFKQNMMLFVKQGHPLEQKLTTYRAPISSARMIVPKYHERSVRMLTRQVKRLRREVDAR